MKSKRYKVQCCACGAHFNNDYKQSHENKIHGGKHVQIKTVGAPENPFAAAKRIRSSIPSTSAEVCATLITLKIIPCKY